MASENDEQTKALGISSAPRGTHYEDHRCRNACTLDRRRAGLGDDGHKTVALIAEHYLTPDAKAQVTALLAADTDNLTAHDIASEATWADRYRDTSNRKLHYQETKNWHFIDREITDPDFKVACFGRLPLSAGTLASNGPANACVVDKINRFAAEIAAPRTDADERLFALKFLLHFVGDMHQPLHSSDNHDAGGNSQGHGRRIRPQEPGQPARLLGHVIRRCARQSAGRTLDAVDFEDHA